MLCTILPKYHSAVNLCEYKIMRIGQFWRLLKLYAIFNYAILLPERFSLYDTESMKGARRRKKSGLRTLGQYSGPHTPSRVQYTIDQGINFLVTLCDAILSTFFCLNYSFLSLTQRAAVL